MYTRTRERGEDVRRVIEAVRKSELKRFVYHSSVCADPNSQSRALSQAAEAEGIVSSLKCSMISGCASSVLMGRGDGFFPAGMVETAKAPNPVMGILGYGGTMIQPVHVDDMARCVTALFQNGGLPPGVVNVAGPEITTPLELIDSFLDKLGRVKLKLHAPLFVLKLLTAAGASAEFKEKINLLFEIFCTEHNDSFKLLGSTGKLLTPRQSLDEMLSAA